MKIDFDGFMKELENNDIEIAELPELLVKELSERKLKIATAESCTGGLISKMITDVSGASAVFDCGVCSYANEIKAKVLSVSEEDLRTKGAVSREVAMQMAKGVRELSGSDIGISTTGIAGPTGGSKEKPVGTVFIGVSTIGKNYGILANLAAKNATRDKIRQSAAFLAIYCGFKEAKGENY
ncbi:MAG: CinA family protein [Ruminococcaceae bacterium]|nr:CinA family protein [Oscillospiraceae bacterium]